MARILIVDNLPSVVRLLGAVLKVEGHEVETALDGKAAIEFLEKQAFDLMICEVRLPSVDGVAVLKRAKAIDPRIAAIMLESSGCVHTAAETVKYGAFDYVTKPFKADELRLIVRRALAYHASEVQKSAVPDRSHLHWGLESVVARSSAMILVCEMAMRVAPTDATILISGEDGVGKEAVAKGIHVCSRRCNGPFQTVFCAAYPEAMVEEAIFGQGEKTDPDAIPSRMGSFEATRGGTLFLDEIGALPLKVQERLIGAMREGSDGRKEGGHERSGLPAPRLLVATSKSLKSARDAGLFREDLYGRIAPIKIEIPPLRERREDVLALADHFLKADLTTGRRYTLTPEAQAALELYSWPGNVRELENAIRHAITFAKGAVIAATDLHPKIRDAGLLASPAPAPSGADDFRGQALKAFLKSKKSEYIPAR